MKEFKEKLSKIFDIDNERVNTRQVNSSAYYDKKIKDEKLLVEMLMWDRPYKILLEKHPVQEIQINGKSKWLTRDKLRKCEQSISDKNGQVDNVNRDYDITDQTEHVQIEIDSDSDSEAEDNDHNNSAHQNERYNLRRHVDIPERYGDYVMHQAKSLF